MSKATSTVRVRAATEATATATAMAYSPVSSVTTSLPGSLPTTSSHRASGRQKKVFLLHILLPSELTIPFRDYQGDHGSREVGTSIEGGCPGDYRVGKFLMYFIRYTTDSLCSAKANATRGPHRCSPLIPYHSPALAVSEVSCRRALFCFIQNICF